MRELFLMSSLLEKVAKFHTKRNAYDIHNGTKAEPRQRELMIQEVFRAPRLVSPVIF